MGLVFIAIIGATFLGIYALIHKVQQGDEAERRADMEMYRNGYVKVPTGCSGQLVWRKANDPDNPSLPASVGMTSDDEEEPQGG